MNMRKWQISSLTVALVLATAGAVTAFALASGGSGNDDEDVADEWELVEASDWTGGVSLRLPLGWQLNELQGWDSYVGDPSGQGEEPPPEGLGGHHLLAQTDARCPAGDVVGHHLYRQPGGVGGEATRGEMVQPHTVLEVSDGILDLGVAAMVGLQFEHLPVPVGDEAVIAVGGEEGQLGTGRGLHTPDDEPYRRGVRFTLEGSAGGLGHIGGAVHPVGNGSPGISGIAGYRRVSPR